MPTIANRLHLSPRRMLLDGLILGTVFTVLAVGFLRLDARLWLEDYPPDIQAAAGSVGEAPLALRMGAATVLLGAMLGGIVYSNWLMGREHGWAPRFKSVFIHTLVLFWIVNIIDVLIVDWLVFVTIQPPWVVLPGTSGLAGYDDYWFHLDASLLSLQPWLGSIVLAVLIGLALPRFWRRRAGIASMPARNT